MATYCQACGLPVQHDHYVPHDNMFGIYRGPTSRWSPVIPFGPEHEWLRQAVGVRVADHQPYAVVRGEVHDGYLESDHIDDGLVLDGMDERAALHERCWQLAGEPQCWTAPFPGAPDVEAYKKHQLFDFGKLVADGKGWMLADPTMDLGARSQERILRLLAAPTP